VHRVRVRCSAATALSSSSSSSAAVSPPRGSSRDLSIDLVVKEFSALSQARSTHAAFRTDRLSAEHGGSPVLVYSSVAGVIHEYLLRPTFSLCQIRLKKQLRVQGQLKNRKNGFKTRRYSNMRPFSFESSRFIHSVEKQDDQSRLKSLGLYANVGRDRYFEGWEELSEASVGARGSLSTIKVRKRIF
jgi:hypothetical protein